jgi:hypothetical protein
MEEITLHGTQDRRKLGSQGDPIEQWKLEINTQLSDES